VSIFLLKRLLIIILEAEDLLNNPIISRVYTEENGEYKGVSRIVVRKFRIYFERHDSNIVIIAILFPGEK
jgi:plasmid stabilization system protein ParE